MASERIQVKTKVCREGGKLYAHFDIDQQGFNVMPAYEEGVDEDAGGCALHMATMLGRALHKIASANPAAIDFGD